jgi:hypothetical protein
MDLFQLLISLPFVDQRKLTSKVLTDWGWSLDSIAQSQDAQAAQGQGAPPQDPNAAAGGQPPQGGQPQQSGPDLSALMAQAGGGQGQPSAQESTPMPQTQHIDPSVVQQALSMMRQPTPQGPGADSTGFSGASSPMDILGAQPGTAPTAGLGAAPTHGKTGPNQRGHNRGGKVNTTVSQHQQHSNPESALQTQSQNIQ